MWTFSLVNFAFSAVGGAGEAAGVASFRNHWRAMSPSPFPENEMKSGASESARLATYTPCVEKLLPAS